MAQNMGRDVQVREVLERDLAGADAPPDSSPVAATGYLTTAPSRNASNRQSGGKRLTVPAGQNDHLSALLDDHRQGMFIGRASALQRPCKPRSPRRTSLPPTAGRRRGI